MKRLFALLFLLAALPASADGLPAPVLAALEAARIPAANVAVVVQPVDGPAPLLAHNARQPMNPASVMKLLTTYAALDLLGPAYTWKTAALADEPPAAGTLAGNLYLKGSGDPKFALEHLWALLRQLRVRGVERIAGDVVLDRAAFALPAMEGSFDDQPMRPYNVGPDALLVNFRALRFTLLGGDGRVQLLQETPSDGLAIDNRLQLSEGQCGDDWKDRIAIRLLQGIAGSRLEFSGSYADKCGERVLSLAPLPADAQVDGLFRALWRELGGTLGGEVRSGVAPAGARLLAEQESPPLADVVRDINKFSNNVMARQLYLTLGNGGGTDSAERARQRIGDWLAGRGLAFPELVLENGSGLSRRERISAQSLNRLLLDAWNSAVMPELVSSLPVAGIDGTMKKRLADSGARGRAHIKTGTLDGVKTAAGYVQDMNGRRHAAIFLINDPRARYGQAAIDALLAWVAGQGESPPLPPPQSKR